jgi:hypothetical protein
MIIVGCDFHPELGTGLLVRHGDGRDRGTEAGTRRGRGGAFLSAVAQAGAGGDGSDGRLSLAGGFARRKRA